VILYSSPERHRVGKKTIETPNKDQSQIAGDLADVVRGDVFADIVHRVAYSTDASIYRIVPQCIVAPRDAADVVSVVRYAADRGIAVAARGAGSGVAGESLCNGIVLDMTRYLNRITGVSSDGSVVTCEPGVVLDDLNKFLAEYGRKIGPDPSSANRATVGGCVANNATGAHSLQYGHISGYVESIEAVLADGSLVLFKNDFDLQQADNKALQVLAKQCESVLSENEAVIAEAMPKTKRNRSGYNIAGICHDGKMDLAKLMVGSEGTLAIFTKITLRTVPLPGATGLLQLEFDSLEKMAQAVPAIVKTGVTACELIDKILTSLAIDALPQYKDILPANTAAALLVEHIGENEKECRQKLEKTDEAVGKLAGGRRFVFDSKTQARLWKSRKDAGPLLYRKHSRKHPAEFMEDTSVDHTRLNEYIVGLQEIAKKYDVTWSFYGHAGDGELHLRPFLDLGDPKDVEKMRAIADDVFSLVWSLGGSISGEHADGLVRSAFVKRQYGEQVYELLRKIKNTFDPEGVLNPGKIINEDPAVMVKDLRRAPKIVPERIRTELLFDKNELELELEQCYGCGLCLSREPELRMCPVFRAMGEELASSRAKASVLHFWATGQLDEKDFESSDFRKFLDLCINCKACRRQCPSGVDISKLMSMVRAQYAKRKGLRRAEFVLSHNRYLSMLGGTFAPVSNFFMQAGPFKWLMQKTAGIDSRREMPVFRRGSFLKVGRKYLAACKPIEKPIDKVAYFVDTFANYNDHELGFAVLDVLRHNDIEVVLPKQRPAPLPAIVYGDVRRARRDLAYSVKHLAKAVQDGYKIVCSEPSAALCLRDELRHFVAGENAKLVSENTYELMNYLFTLLMQKKLKPPTKAVKNKFVYHLPCHLCAVGSETATVELLQKHFGIEVIDLKSGCCGLAGTFGMQKKNYDLSSQIGAGLREALEKSPTKNVLTECSACKMQIEHISLSIVTHPVKLLAESYGCSVKGK